MKLSDVAYNFFIFIFDQQFDPMYGDFMKQVGGNPGLIEFAIYTFGPKYRKLLAEVMNETDIAKRLNSVTFTQ